MTTNCHDCHTTPCGKCRRHRPVSVPPEYPYIAEAVRKFAALQVEEYNRESKRIEDWFKRGVEAMRGSKP